MFKQVLHQIETAAAEGSKPEPELITVKYLRTLIGIMGMILAGFLAVGSAVFGQCDLEFQPSISHYYFTNMRDFFVGTLFAVAVFLFCYKGHNKWDNRASTLAAIFAFITALLPTDVEHCTSCRHWVVSFLDFSGRGYFHLVSASLFLLTLALMSIFLFTISDQSQLPPRKKTRNRVYYFTGISIIVCLIGAGLSIVLKLNEKVDFPFVFAFEAASLVAFGVSWLTKGGLFYRDKEEVKHSK